MEEQVERTERERIKWFLQMTATGGRIFNYLFASGMVALLVFWICCVNNVLVWLFDRSIKQISTAVSLIGLVFSYLLYVIGMINWQASGMRKLLENKGYKKWQINGELISKEKYGAIPEIQTRFGRSVSLKKEKIASEKEIKRWVFEKGGSQEQGLLWLIIQEAKLIKMRRKK